MRHACVRLLLVVAVQGEMNLTWNGMEGRRTAERGGMGFLFDCLVELLLLPLPRGATTTSSSSLCFSSAKGKYTFLSSRGCHDRND
jgi:hypothetical protein